MKHRYSPTKRQDPYRWLKLGLVSILLSFMISGCGILSETEPSQTGGLRADEIARIEAAVERAEAAAEQAETVAQRIETVAGQSEAILERLESIPNEIEVVAAGSQVSATEPNESGSSANTDPIKIGLVVDLQGIYVTGGEDAIRTVNMAVAESGGEINGRPIEIIVEGSDSTAPDIALAAARKLIEEDQVDIVIGPSSSDEGLAIRDYARDHLNKTFLNGTSAAQDITLRDPSPNYFRFSTDGVQWMAGLGEYVYEEKGYHRIVTLADDYSFNYTHVGGFLIDFCQAGGEVVERFWTPIDATDYSSVIEIIPTDIDAIYVSLGGTNSLQFIRQFDEVGRRLPIIAGSVTLDQSVLNAEAELADYIVGAAAAGPIADNSPDEVWQDYVATYREMFPDGLPSPSLFGSTYYVNAKAAMLALEKVQGDLSDDQQAFQEALRNLEYDSPMGRLRLDQNRQVIGSNFITEVARDEEGILYNKFVKEVAGIDQTLGLGQETFIGLGLFSPNNPLCRDIRAAVANAPVPEPQTSEESDTPLDNEPIKVGVIATLDGVYAAAGEDSLRGVKMALAEFDNQINGRPIEIIPKSSDAAAPDIALQAARELIEEEEIDILVGPLTSDEGLLIRDYAKDYPEKTFLNGNAAAQDVTLRNPASNFFSFSMDGAQWMAGLGTYVYEEQGYQRVATLANDYSFAYTHVGGFLIDYCQAGGEVSEKFWVPFGTTDYTQVMSVMPSDIDAIYVALAGTDSLNFIEQFKDFGGQIPIIAGGNTVEQSILDTGGESIDYIVGTLSASSMATDNPDEAWQEFVSTYQAMFPEGFSTPSLPAYSYYLNSKAMLLALQEVEGDLSDGQQAFQKALSDLTFDSPTGPVRLDENRRAIASNFITAVALDEEGNLYNKFVKEVGNVDQALGLDREAYLKLGVLSRNNPTCEDVRTAVANTPGNNE